MPLTYRSIRDNNDIPLRSGQGENYSFVNLNLLCERFEPRSHFKRLSLIVRVNVVLNRTVVVDSG